MSRTREELLGDIEYCTKEAEFFINLAEKNPKWTDKYTKWAEDHVEVANEAKQELKAFDEANNEKN